MTIDYGKEKIKIKRMSRSKSNLTLVTWKNLSQAYLHKNYVSFTLGSLLAFLQFLEYTIRVFFLKSLMCYTIKEYEVPIVI